MNLTNRISDGWVRVIITVLYFLLSAICVCMGTFLIKAGAQGEWKILADFKEVPLYITSLSPGILVILAGILIMCWGLPKTIKSLK
ncbi:MAG: hypothetical protein WCW16_05565 [Candidatus Magasanikbacteria bacterium]